jgi:hypothetical protein
MTSEKLEVDVSPNSASNSDINTSKAINTEVGAQAPNNNHSTILPWIGLVTSAAFLTTSVACPAMIPFGFAQAATWVHITAYIAFAGTSMASLYIITNDVKKRLQEDKVPTWEKTLYTAVLAIVLAASLTALAAMFLAPATLPFGLAAVAALSAMYKAGIASLLGMIAIGSAASLYSLWSTKRVEGDGLSPNNFSAMRSPSGQENAQPVNDEGSSSDEEKSESVEMKRF